MNSLQTVNVKNLLKIAAPIMLSQATETIMLFIDRIFLSGLGDRFIGPSMSGGLSSFVFQSLFIGILMYLNAITSQHYGAGKKIRAVRYLVQGLWLAVFFYPLALLMIPVGLGIFHVSGHAPSQIDIEFRYFSILMTGAIFVFVKSALAGYLIGMGKTRSVMAGNILGMVVNIPLNYALIYGNFGFPALGIAGAAVGTITGSFVAGIALFLLLLREKNWRASFRCAFLRPSIRMMRRFLRFSLPAGFEHMVNVFAFNLFLQFMHSYGTNIAASVTIAFNFDLLAFIPILGLGASTTTMVGYQIGAGDILQARKALRLNLIAAYVFAGSMVAIFLIFTPWLVSIFSSSDEVVPLAQIMLRMAAIYTLADATQVVFSGALRGAGDVRWVMIISAAVNWSLAILSFVLIKLLQVEPVLMWGVFVFHVLAIGLLMALRYRTGRWAKMSLVAGRVES